MSFDGSFNLPIGDHNTKDNAPGGYIRFMVGADGVLRTKDSVGNVKTYATGISPEEVQDIVGQFIASSSSITATYDDNGNVLSFVVNQSAIDHGALANLNLDHHTQYLNNTRGDARYYTKTAMDLLLNAKQDIASLGSSVLALLLTGFTVGTNTAISATDSILEAFRKLQAQLNGKEPTISSGTTSQYWRGDKTWQTHDKASVGLSNVPNTDATNPANIVQTISYRFVTDTEKTSWNAKEPAIVNPNDTSKYYRGDKTWATLDKSTIGLGNVDNTSDSSKPISTLTQTALDAKYDASNPSGFETPTQLNARDTANRSRVNHTGTQLSSTISDFLTSVLGSVLTGISFATNSAILATDSLLVALGKIQAQINGHFGSGGSSHLDATTTTSGFMSGADKTKLDGLISDVILFITSALTSTSNVTFTTIPALQIPVVAGKRYKFESYLLFDSNATTTGITISIGGTATGTLRAIAEAPVSNTAGTANEFSGPINAINGVMTTTGVGAVGTQYRAQIEGVFTATSNGFIYPQFRSEVNGSQVRVNIDSNMVYKEY